MRKLAGVFLLCITFGSTYAQAITPHVHKKNDKKVTVSNLKKLVIIGLTDNLEARTTFERKMKARLSDYHIDAYQSTEISSIIFTTVDKAEEELNELIAIVSQKGHDNFMITAVTGVEEKREDAEGYFGTYKVYHLETDIYTLDANQISLVWGMCLDIYDYQLEALAIEDYVHAIIFQMEYENMLSNDHKTAQLPDTN